MVTNGQIRGNLLQMQIALNGVQDNVFNSDDTPNNVDNRQWWIKATNAVNACYAATPTDSNSIDQNVVDAFNEAKVAYDVFKSTYGEFGTTVFPSFSSAVYQALQELPQTVGNAVGAVVDTAGSAGFGVIKAFFGRLGIWGWVLLVGIGIAVLTYVFPHWIAVVKGVVNK